MFRCFLQRKRPIHKRDIFMSIREDGMVVVTWPSRKQTRIALVKTSQVRIIKELTSCMHQKRLRPSDDTLCYACRGNTSRICEFRRYNCCSSYGHKILPSQCSQCFGSDLTDLPPVSNGAWERSLLRRIRINWIYHFITSCGLSCFPYQNVRWIQGTGVGSHRYKLNDFTLFPLFPLFPCRLWV